MNLGSGLAARTDTVRDHQERINKVLLHLQENPGAPLSVEQLARIACFSPFHFHRLFVAYVGEPLSAHVRRLRLERAALLLRNSRASVTEVALESGYETSAAFNKAFQQHFHVSPTTFRQSPPINFPAAVKPKPGIRASIHMKPRIVNRSEKQAVFVRRTGAYKESASAAWEAVCGFAYPRGLVQADREFIGISHDDPQITSADKLRYDACITVSQPVKPEGEVGVQKVAGGRYAVFLHEGPYENLIRTYQVIFGEWLPSSGQELRDVPSFELYLNTPQDTRPENLKTEIYIPLK
ncbi:MAG TPA: AraC family transcriptional regulator [Verrucomicrobiota bacterium]|nr:AraC family transcriptional regulator [Verrucomicrobiota bacterium]